VLGRDGGFVFTAVHNVMGDVPPQNIVAMYDEAYACGVAQGSALV
jgi:uroporphyrinogen decarboxylase